MGPQKSNSYYEAFHKFQGADACWTAGMDTGSVRSGRWMDGHSQSKGDRSIRERLRRGRKGQGRGRERGEEWRWHTSG